MTARAGEPGTLAESVAHALAVAIDDPQMHRLWSSAACQPHGPRRRQRWCILDESTSSKALSVFDSAEIPGIGVDRYLLRLKSVFRCSDAAFVAALILLDRFLGSCGRDGRPQPLTMRNVHRLFLASLVVAVKYNEDMVYGNGHYAKAGGVHVREVNRLERYLLGALDYDLHVYPEQYTKYEMALRAHCEGPKALSALFIADAMGSSSRVEDASAPRLAGGAAVLAPAPPAKDVQRAGHHPAEGEGCAVSAGPSGREPKPTVAEQS